VFLESFCVGADFHALEDGGHAGRQQLVAALDLHQAQPARTHIAQPFQVAERGNVDVILPRNLQDGLAPEGAYFLSVDDECFDFNGVAHANTSAGASILQTPAGQRLC
jgi:hypothetical protein